MVLGLFLAFVPGCAPEAPPELEPASLAEDDDADSDGLSLEDEQVLGTHPNRADSDGDGLGDGHEVFGTATDPMSADTDGDGLDDGSELEYGLDPLQPWDRR